jgi:YVTN family beta-propeller protein
VSPDGARLYVSEDTPNAVQVVSTTTNTVTATITGFDAPKSLALNSAGTLLYVVNENANTVSVVDTSTNTVTATITGFQRPTGVAISSSGGLLYVANSSSNLVSVVDTSNNTITTTIPGFSVPYGIALAPSAFPPPVPIEPSALLMLTGLLLLFGWHTLRGRMWLSGNGQRKG